MSGPGEPTRPVTQASDPEAVAGAEAADAEAAGEAEHKDAVGILVVGDTVIDVLYDGAHIDVGGYDATVTFPEQNVLRVTVYHASDDAADAWHQAGFDRHREFHTRLADRHTCVAERQWKIQAAENDPAVRLDVGRIVTLTGVAGIHHRRLCAMAAERTRPTTVRATDAVLHMDFEPGCPTRAHALQPDSQTGLVITWCPNAASARVGAAVRTATVRETRHDVVLPPFHPSVLAPRADGPPVARPVWGATHAPCCAGTALLALSEDGTLVFTCTSGHGGSHALVGICTDTGTVAVNWVWSDAVAAGPSALAVCGARIFMATADGKILTFDALPNELRLSSLTTACTYAPHSMAVCGNALYIGFSSATSLVPRASQSPLDSMPDGAAVVVMPPDMTLAGIASAADGLLAVCCAQPGAAAHLVQYRFGAGGDGARRELPLGASATCVCADGAAIAVAVDGAIVVLDSHAHACWHRFPVAGVISGLQMRGATIFARVCADIASEKFNIVAYTL